MSIHDVQGETEVPKEGSGGEPPDFSSMTVAAIGLWLAERAGEDGPWRALLEADERVGVRRLGLRHAARLQKAEKERRRLEGMLEWERRLQARGVEVVAGVDEAGRGCLAGPVFAAAVVLPVGAVIEGLDDSKKLTPASREALFERIQLEAVAVGVGRVDAPEIDRINILQAALKAMRLALEGLGCPVGHVLVDGDRCPGSAFEESALIEGDARSMSIAAASVVAKVSRDRCMRALDAEYPLYGFAGHKGYGSPEHLEALQEHGPCPLHRRSFGPVAALLKPAASDAYRTFSEGVENCGSMAELERMGTYIGEGAGLMSVQELATLRRLYRRRRDFLGHPGRRGEEAAADFLVAKGYELVQRSYRGGGGEIDLVLRDGECLVFVEVKTVEGGAGDERPEERVDRAKRRRLTAAARAYMAARDGEARFDVVAVELAGEQPRLHHIENAFESE